MHAVNKLISVRNKSQLMLDTGSGLQLNSQSQRTKLLSTKSCKQVWCYSWNRFESLTTPAPGAHISWWRVVALDWPPGSRVTGWDPRTLRGAVYRWVAASSDTFHYLHGKKDPRVCFFLSLSLADINERSNKSDSWRAPCHNLYAWV